MLIHALLSLMPMFVALFWAILLLLNKKRNLPQLYLAVFLMLSCVNYMAHASFFLYEYKLFAFLDNLWVFTSLAGYPLYYYYILDPHSRLFAVSLLFHTLFLHVAGGAQHLYPPNHVT